MAGCGIFVIPRTSDSLALSSNPRTRCGVDIATNSLRYKRTPAWGSVKAVPEQAVYLLALSWERCDG